MTESDSAAIFFMPDETSSESQPTPRPETTGAAAHEAASDLLPQLYDELRQLARANMRRERPGQTLQATALVHEAYMRLVGDDDPGPRLASSREDELHREALAAAARDARANATALTETLGVSLG